MEEFWNLWRSNVNLKGLQNPQSPAVPLIQTIFVGMLEGTKGNLKGAPEAPRVLFKSP